LQQIDTAVRILGTTAKASVSQQEKDRVIETHGSLPTSYALAAKITPVLTFLAFLPFSLISSP
jgi:hypothetical protein